MSDLTQMSAEELKEFVSVEKQAKTYAYNLCTSATLRYIAKLAAREGWPIQRCLTMQVNALQSQVDELMNQNLRMKQSVQSLLLTLGWIFESTARTLLFAVILCVPLAWILHTFFP